MALARALDIKNHQTLYGWKRVPPEYVLKIAEITETSASEIDPVLYPPHLFQTANKDAETA